MSQTIEFKSTISNRGGSTYLLLPIELKKHYNISPKSKCVIIPDTKNRVNVVFG